VVTNPPADLTLTSLAGPARTVQEWVTNFHLVTVVVDPYANESAWILATAARVLRVFQGADCRVSFLVVGPPDDARAFLGPLATEFLTFVDPDGAVVKALGLDHLPALVHLAIDGTVAGSAEGWDPDEWRSVVHALAKVMSWKAPTIPDRGDPAPFPGMAIPA
jgi:hypothetical protein